MVDNGDFDEFERMLEDSDFIDVANPHAQGAVKYAAEQSARMRQYGQLDYRQREQPAFPYPERDNPMFAYLINQARILERDKDMASALLWLGVHAWFEGALNALEVASRPGGGEPDSPRSLSTHYGDCESATEMIKAAELLSLGVRIHNRWVVEEESPDGSGSATEEWVVELLDRAPEVPEEPE